MNILLVGSGAREHAIAKALKKNNNTRIFAYGSNDNSALFALCDYFSQGALTDISNIVAFALEHQCILAIIGPEAPLEVGLADKLIAAKIKVIGPSKALARIETSKGFARDLLAKYQVPGLPRYHYFSQFQADVMDFLHSFGDEYVIKADGLMGGKGVLLSGEHLHSHQEAMQHCKNLQSAFVIEEKLMGPEFSLMSFVDGKSLVHMPLVQDHKRAFVGDLGPNTGGMGSYSAPDHLLPFLTEQDVQQAQKINEHAIDALQAEYDAPYVGILYGGFMLTAQGVKLIEYNARFGDPEAINVLALLDNDLMDIFQKMTQGMLHNVSVRFKHQASVVKYVVPNGYPTNPTKGSPIDIHDVTDKEALFFASIDQQQNQLLMAGSRAIAVLGIGDTIATAEHSAQMHAKKIKGDCFYRPDIGTETLISQRIEMANQLRKISLLNE